MNFIRTGKENDGLYYLEPLKKNKMAMEIFGKIVIWHRRLVHASEDVLKSIQQLDIIKATIFMILVLWLNKVDYLYLLVFHKLTNFFQIIYIDICGCHHHATLSRYHYFLSIVDDYSRATWFYLMKNK